MPIDLDTAFNEAADMIDERRLELPIDIDHRELLALLNQLVGGTVGSLQGLADDDAQHNEEVLRTAAVEATMTAFVAGVRAASEQTNRDTQSDVVVVCSPDELESLAVTAIRDGVVTLHLVASDGGVLPADPDQ